MDDDFGLGLIKVNDFGWRKQSFGLGFSSSSSASSSFFLSFFFSFLFQFQFDYLYEFGSRFRTILMILWCVCDDFGLGFPVSFD